MFTVKLASGAYIHIGIENFMKRQLLDTDILLEEAELWWENNISVNEHAAVTVSGTSDKAIFPTSSDFRLVLGEQRSIGCS